MFLLEKISMMCQSIFNRFFHEPFYMCTYTAYMEDHSSTIKRSGWFPSTYKEKEDAIRDCEEYLQRNTPVGYIVECDILPDLKDGASVNTQYFNCWAGL